MLKMVLDPMGGIVLTNDGNAILREIDVAHPAAKSMIELSRTQDEEVGDGTTSVIILGKRELQLACYYYYYVHCHNILIRSLLLAGELLALCQPFLERNIHPII